ncbi:MAG: cellulase family glycosylhydrolase [Bacteroidales bacterium]|nr:cellulase family glycosylhydrolase [Bacteroidales bacterium]
MKLYKIISILLLIHTISSMAQSGPDVIVDANGILRWPDQSEVKGFGINYTVPFAHAYRAAKRMGIDPKKSIDDDIYHFARLGLDAYRMHVWDTEISDTLGNLLDNEHLDLFDYMLKKMKDRGMKFILTPIAFWGNGWPEPADNTPGYSNKYGKEACLTNPEAIKAQETYLFQFLNHVNPYTGIAYKNDPDIVAFEVSNEPHHNEDADKVTAYISKLLSAMRKTGCKKPVFYNVSHSIHLSDAYYAADIQGGTFQWYPTGLTSQEELGGNLLPNVDKYDIPFKNDEGFIKGAKIVYEFDAADVGRSYIYPAMARSFRTAGIQWATQFAYDPTYLAYANTEYNTHYMNLVYAPQKALSLKIASKVFHEIPMYQDFGSYPENSQFGNFRVNYENDLAEMITDQKFFYTNNTNSLPPDSKKLKEIAGFGNSQIVKYGGQGAYFLDRLEKGVWRLEVLPDAIWTRNIFGRNSPDKTVAVIQWNEWPMTITLPDLGKDFSIDGLNDGNSTKISTKTGFFNITPGTYILSVKGKATTWKSDSQWKNIRVGEFFAPESTVKSIWVVHNPINEILSGTELNIKTTVASPEPIRSVKVLAFGAWRPKSYEMKNESGFEYTVTIPKEEIKEGYFRYYIVVENESSVKTYPSGSEGNPMNWDFYQNETYKVNIIPENSPLYLFDAASDYEQLNMAWNRGVSLRPTAEPSKAVLNIDFDKIPKDEAASVQDYSIRHYFGNKIKGRNIKPDDFNTLIVQGNSTTKKPEWVQISLITANAEIFGGLVQINEDRGDYRIKLSDLKKTRLVTLPRPYPGFLPYYFESSPKKSELTISAIESLQISIGPGLSEDQLNMDYGLQIKTIRLE